MYRNVRSSNAGLTETADVPFDASNMVGPRGAALARSAVSSYQTARSIYSKPTLTTLT